MGQREVLVNDSASHRADLNERAMTLVLNRWLLWASQMMKSTEQEMRACNPTLSRFRTRRKGITELGNVHSLEESSAAGLMVPEPSRPPPRPPLIGGGGCDIENIADAGETGSCYRTSTHPELRRAVLQAAINGREEERAGNQDGRDMRLADERKAVVFRDRQRHRTDALSCERMDSR